MPERLARAAVIFAASVALGVYAGLIAVALAMPYRVDLRPPFIIASCVVASVSLLRGLLWWAELEEADKPPRVLPAPVVRIEQVSPDRKQLQYEDCPATEGQLTEVATRSYYGSAISNGMEDIFDGRPGYTVWRDWMISRGYCRWRGSTPQAGVETTGAGDEWLSRFYQPPALLAYAYRKDDGVGVAHAHTQEE